MNATSKPPPQPGSFYAGEEIMVAAALYAEKATDVEFYLYPTVGTVLIHSVKPELTE